MRVAQFLFIVFHVFRGCCSRVCSGCGLAAWIWKMGLCVIPPLLRRFGGSSVPVRGCRRAIEVVFLLLCYCFGYNYRDVVLHFLLVSTDVPAAVRINTAHSFLTASTFLVAAVFTGEVTQGSGLAESLSFIFWLGGPPYLSAFCLGSWLLVLAQARW